MEVSRFTLENGLRLVHLLDESTEMVHVNILYGVGAKNEDYEYTGLAHLLEHLMFGGTELFPSFDDPLEEAGADSNAFTNNDFTNYYISLPRMNAELAFCMESDRLCNLLLDEESVDVQRQVVMEEFKQSYLNKPYGDVSALMRRLSFKKHPYRWSTIGRKLKHISEVPAEVVRDFYDRHYTPGNAVLSVVGNISFEQAKEWTLKWFASIPARGCNKREIPCEPRQERMRRKSVVRNVPGNALYMTFHMDSFTGAGYYAADVISDIFANGYSGRLNENLVKRKKLFTRIDAFITCNEHPGLFWIESRLADGVSFERAEAAIWEELEKLKEREVPRCEMEKVRNRFESEQVFTNSNGEAMAANLAQAEWYGDVSRAWRETELYRKVTPKEVQQAARELFRKGNASVLYYKKR